MCDILDDSPKNNIKLEFSQTYETNSNTEQIEEEKIDWDKYSKTILDSINIIDERPEEITFSSISSNNHTKSESGSKQKKGINPFLEEEISKTYLSSDINDELTLEKSILDSWDNYKVKELQKVAEFYEIPYKGKSKNKLIEKIMEFEEKIENAKKVYDREVYWNMMNYFSNNNFFKKYIINWNI